MRIHLPLKVLIGFTFLLVTFVNACSLTDNNQENRSVPTPTPTLQAKVSPQEMQLREDEIRRNLKREAKRSNLKNLEELSLNPLSSETRIWVGFDGVETPCFLVRRDGAEKSAALISARIIRRDGKDIVTPVRMELTSPRSGWSSFETFFKDKGVTIPLKFSLDNMHLIDPDERLLIIEMKSDSAYSMVFFPLGTETEDGRRALQICQKVEQEFGISIRCTERKS